MNYVENFKKHLDSDNLSSEYLNFTQEGSTFTIRLNFGGITQDIVIHPTYLEIHDTDFTSSGTSLWDDFEEVKEFSNNSLTLK